MTKELTQIDHEMFTRGERIASLMGELKSSPILEAAIAEGMELQDIATAFMSVASEIKEGK